MCAAGFLSGCASGHKQFLYVAGPGTNETFEFRVQPDGSLAPLGTPNFPVGSNPVALKPHTSGDFLYIADFSGNDVTLLDINQSNGNLSVPVSISIVNPVNPPNIFATDKGPISLAMSPTAPFLYVVNQIAGNVTGYIVDPGSGSLAIIQGPPVAGFAVSDCAGVASFVCGDFTHGQLPVCGQWHGRHHRGI